MQKSFYKKVCSFGPGGVKCSCCFPPSGSKARKGAKREAGKTVRRMFSNLIAKGDQE